MTLSILLWSYLIWSDTHKRFCDTKITQHSTAIGNTITPDPCEKLKNGVIFELEDLSHPLVGWLVGLLVGWFVGWLVANSNEMLGSGKFLMEGCQKQHLKNMEVWKWHTNSERLTPMEVHSGHRPSSGFMPSTSSKETKPEAKHQRLNCWKHPN